MPQGDDRDGDRGQMLLVAALGLAVAFVALALVLNAVVFTENLATRNPDAADDALAFEGAVTEGVGGLLAETNRHNDTDYATLDDALRAGVVAWDANASRLTAADGTVTAVELRAATNGTRIVQETAGAFTADDGATAWMVAGDVSGVRRFVVVADPASTSPVSVNVSDGDGDYWRVDVADDGSGDATVTVTENGSTVTIPHDDATVAVDLTEGTVNGSDAGVTFAAGVDAPFDVTVSDGDRATGRYQLFVDRELGAFATDAPTTRPAIYRATVDVTVHRSSVTYESPVALAPEDAPGNDTLTQ
ncbi:DUF7261 family protein [Halobacterium jilantaiense]|uniref:Uncharacterized protein n=1 Tax=Halobacterium jilantaiense TaxID=355548 RepID=A0A1I0N9J5_9EURY|nr:hypothetical protein [Halobacterium jilantaiense]SEV97763.1 hypothetical protein SAMN04487945_0697 [Halobacterium jilantaiense]